jgi:hypothetical protein
MSLWVTILHMDVLGKRRDNLEPAVPDIAVTAADRNSAPSSFMYAQWAYRVGFWYCFRVWAILLLGGEV